MDGFLAVSEAISAAALLERLAMSAPVGAYEQEGRQAPGLTSDNDEV
jgi:hypothetical protein